MSARMLEHFKGPLIQLAPETSSIVYQAAFAPPASLRIGQELILLSWNLLAPPYKRMGGGTRESDGSDVEWQARVRMQIDYVGSMCADIIGLQEFWCSNAAFVSMWRDFAEERHYHMFLSPRTRGKADGLCLLVKASIELEVVGVEAPHRSQLASMPAFSTWSFNDWGDRVVQMLQLPVDGGEPISLLHTHLTFPHPNDHDPAMRRCQAAKLAEHVQGLPSPNALVFGDLNGGVDDEAVADLQLLGGFEPMPRARDPWISHVAHNGAHMACDLLLRSGRCSVIDWSLGFTQEALIANALSSDHRPLLATVLLEAAEVAQKEQQMSADLRADVDEITMT